MMGEGNGASPAGTTGDERYERGLAIRKQVLGEAHVERSLAAVSEFSRPIQEFVTGPAGATSGVAPAWTGAPAVC
jgi:hypothetical protein